MKISRLVSRTAALAGLATLSVGAVHAQGITVSFIPGSSGVITATDYQYTYQFFLQPQTSISPASVGNNPDAITFYDYRGLILVGGSAPSFVGSGGATFNLTTPFTGVNPDATTQLAGDDASIRNVSLIYTGSVLANASNVSQSLGTLTLHSTLTPNPNAATAFAASSTNTNNGQPAGNQSFTTGPNPRLVTSTPEPGTWAMFAGMGISGLAFARRRNRRK